jgi:hypothetical protein
MGILVSTRSPGTPTDPIGTWSSTFNIGPSQYNAACPLALRLAGPLPTPHIGRLPAAHISAASAATVPIVALVIDPKASLNGPTPVAD